MVLGAAGAQASGSTSGLVLLPLGLQDMSQELQKRAAVRLRILRFPPVFEAYRSLSQTDAILSRDALCLWTLGHLQSLSQVKLPAGQEATVSSNAGSRLKRQISAVPLSAASMLP